jgi:hypothetical protein
MPTATPTAEPPAAATGITVMHRGPSGRWRKIGAARTWAAAVALVNAAGDWWLRLDAEELRDDEPQRSGPGLFDEVEA